MGAWIEINIVEGVWKGIICRTPRWVRGLKSNKCQVSLVAKWRRTPRWVRGLKSQWMFQIEDDYKKVAPHDGCVD